MFLDHISNDLIDQIIPEELQANYKRFCIYYSLGISIREISTITSYKESTINKGLYIAKANLTALNLNQLRVIILLRVFTIFLNHKIN